MDSFAELLTEYMARTGISDAELARHIGVRRQTVFRWKEGLVSRPRHREDVLRCAGKLRLSPEERDALLLAAGFRPEDPSSLAEPDPAPQTESEPAVEVAERPTRQVTQPTRVALSPRWMAVVVGLIAVGVLLTAVWLTRDSVSFPVAGEGETLVVVGRFGNYAGEQQSYNVAGRIREIIEEQIEAARLDGVRVAIWPEEIRDAAAAVEAGRHSGAALVIWGEYDAGRVLTRFTRPEAESELRQNRLEQLVATPSDLSTTINVDLPSEFRYLALLTLGQLYAYADRLEPAQMLLTQALDPPPAEPDAQARVYFHLGYIYQKKEPQELDRAIEFYSRAIALQPGFISAYQNRGTAYLKRGEAGDPDQAIDDLTQVVEAGFTDATVYSNRGAAYLRRDEAGDLNRAIEDLSRAIDLAPDEPAAYFNRGLAYLRLGERERWVEDLEYVISLEPDHAEAHNALCWGYALAQQPNLALPHCDRAVTLDAAGLNYDSRGIVYAQLGRFEEAIADFEAFLTWLQEQPAGMYEHYGPEREAWIKELEAGRNPFDQETLEDLRRE